MALEHINEQDTLNGGRKKLNDSIDASQRAENKSDEAVNIANTKGDEAKQTAQRAEQKSDSTQTQLDTIVINGDSSVEAAQARVDSDGNTYTTLKERIDTEHGEVTSQLAETMTEKISHGDVQKSDYDLSKDLNHWNINDFDEETRAILQGLTPGEVNAVLGYKNVLNENIADDAVGILNVKFVDGGKNLFNKKNVILNKIVNLSTGVEEEKIGWCTTTDYIPVEALQEYKRSHVSGVTEYDSNHNYVRGNGNNDNPITMHESTSYIRLNVQIGQIDIYQFERGSITTDYQNFGQIKIPDLKMETKNLPLGFSNYIKPKKEPKENGISFLIDDFEDLSTSWTTRQARIKPNKFSYSDGTQSLEIISTSPGSYAEAKKDYRPEEGVPLIGKYVRLWIDIPNINDIDRIGILFAVGSQTEPLSDYYYMDFNSSHLTTGLNQMDFRLDAMQVNIGAPQDKDTLRQFIITVHSKEGKTARISVDKLESVSRRPYLTFVNDDTYLEFMEDIVPMLESRKMGYSIQLQKETLEDYLLGNTPSGKSSLQVLRNAIMNGAETGLHINANVGHASDASFRNWFVHQTSLYSQLGINHEGIHITALTNHWGTLERHRFIRRLAKTMRSGSGWLSGVSKDINGLHPIPPSPMMKGYSLTYKEFGTDTTETDVRGWIQDSVNNELGLHVFGHGTKRFQNSYRSSIEVYNAFFDEFDKNSEKIDVLTPSQLYERYYKHLDSSRISDWAYRV